MASASGPTNKKSLFKKPAWATSAAPIESGDFFRHSNAVYDSILEDKERRRERHVRKKQARLPEEENTGVQEGRVNKKPRLSSDDEEEDGDQSGSDPEVSDGHIASSGEGKDVVDVSRSLSRDKSTANPQILSQAPDSIPDCAISQDVNVIEDDLDDFQIISQHTLPDTTGHRKDAEPNEDDSEEEDDYVLELKRRAREKARQQKNQVPAPAQDSAPRLPLHSASREPELSPPPKEPIVQILILTHIPNAKPLLVNRKMSQSLQEVREVWCARQNFSQALASSILLTWRGTRLYDTSTTTTLVNMLKTERGRGHAPSFGSEDLDDPSGGRIEVEAMTQETYDQRQYEKEHPVEKSGHEEYEAAETPAAPKEIEYTITMRAQGLEAFRSKIRPSTKISKIMGAFQKIRNIDSSKTCWLVFDGERLEPEATVADTEIENGDTVDVHVR